MRKCHNEQITDPWQNGEKGCVIMHKTKSFDSQEKFVCKICSPLCVLKTERDITRDILG